jgi:hypothetical protein
MNIVLLIKALIAKLGEHALKISPLLIILYAIFNIYTTVLGYLSVEEQQVAYQDSVKYRTRSFTVGFVMSSLVIVVSSIYFYANLKL